MSSGIGSLMTALVFMLIFTPTNNWDKRVFLQTFTDVKINSKSQLSKYVEGRQRWVVWRNKHRKKEKEHSLYILEKSQRGLGHLSAETLPRQRGLWSWWNPFKVDSTLEAGKKIMLQIFIYFYLFGFGETETDFNVLFLIFGKCK